MYQTELSRRGVETPFGTWTLSARNGALVSLTAEALNFPTEQEGDRAVLDAAQRQLEAYFLGNGQAFDLPLCPEGTPFQQAVWAALRAIPYGETRSYGQIAAAVGRPKAARAVGGACRRNPLLVFIPCHRVLGTGGALTGFAVGVDVKTRLLALEQNGKEEYHG